MKKIKVIGYCLIVLLLAALLFLSACNTTAPSGTSETSGSGTSKLSGPFTIKWSCPWPPASDGMVRREAFLKEFEERHGDKFKFELYGVGQLCESKENVEAVQTGVADIAHIISSYTPGLFPRTQLLESPVFTLYTAHPWNVSYKIMSELAPAIDPELERNGLVPSGLYWLGGVVHIYSKEPLRTVEDFQGVKISCVSEVHSDALKRLGFSPSMIPGAETYLALEKGVVDAALQTHGGAKITKYEEVCNYVTLLGWPQLGFTYAFNPDFMNRLPDDYRQLLVDEFKVWHETVEIDGAKMEDNQSLQFMLDHGTEIIELPDTELQKIEQLLPSIDEWAAEQEKLGISDAEELGQKLLELIKKYTGE